MAVSPTSASRQFALKLTLSFGAVIALLMVTVILLATSLFSTAQEKEENRLSSALAVILTESVTRVSFSGKYHARLLAQEMQARVPELAYISIESMEGQIIAHSDSERNGRMVSAEDTWGDQRASPLGPPVLRERPYGGSTVKEIVLPYRPGFEGRLEGVVRIGVNVQQARLEKRNNLLKLLMLMLALSSGAMMLVYVMSRHFGRTVNSLADQLQGVLRHAPMAIAISDDQGKLLAHSAEFGRLFGPVDQGQRLQDHFTSRLPEPQAASLAALGDRVQKSGLHAEQEIRVLHQDRPCDWHLSAFPIEVDGKQRVRALCTIIFDITDRKQAEEARQKSAAQLRTLIDTIPDLVWLKDPDGIYLECNRRFELLFGAREVDIVGKTDFDFVAPEQAEFFREHDRKAMAMGRPNMNEEEVTFADGHQEILETIKTPIFAGDGSTIGVLGIGRDITERKRAEVRQLQLQTQLLQAQKMESLGNLAGGVAHDMNNVLGAILGLASIHQDSFSSDSPAYQAFDTISRAASRGGQMVKSLLSFARQSPVVASRLDLNELLREVVHLLEHTTLSRVRLELDLVPNLRPIRGDASDLTRAFTNLCVNAVDAMPENGILTLRTILIGPDWIEVQVQDTGTGMPKEVLEKALDPFFTTKEQGKGTGLGLSMVYSTVKAHQGQMDIESEPGRGTLVRIRFPACETAEEVPEPAAESGIASSAKAITVLLVDDDELIRNTMMPILERLGHHAHVVASGEEALAKVVAGFEAEVVILDMNMPGIGGEETLVRLRILRPELPVLLATGRADQVALDLVTAHPRVTLLPKPFDIKTLKQHLEALVRK